MEAPMINLDGASAFALAEAPTTEQLLTEGRVRYLLVSGRQDDGLWGPIGAMWRSQDGRRGGFLVHPWALWAGTEIVRGYRSALERGWSSRAIYEYWEREVWPRGQMVDGEREAESLFLLNELIAAL